MTAPNCSSRPVHAYTDMLRSLAENSRKTAVQVFWAAYLTEKDRAPELHFDGTGMLNGTDACFGGLGQAAAK